MESDLAIVVNRATSSDDSLTPGYLIHEMTKVVGSNDLAAERIVRLLLERFKRAKPIVIMKTIKVFHKLLQVDKGRFKMVCQRMKLSTVLKPLQTFAAPPDPLKGNYYNQSIREETNRTLDLLFSESSNQSYATQQNGLSSRIQGFGNSVKKVQGEMAPNSQSSRPSNVYLPPTSYANTTGSASPARKQYGGIGNPHFADARFQKKQFIDRVKDRFSKYSDGNDSSQVGQSMASKKSAAFHFTTQQDFVNPELQKKQNQPSNVSRKSGQVGGIWASKPRSEVIASKPSIQEQRLYSETFSETEREPVSTVEQIVNIQDVKVAKRKDVETLINSIVFAHKIKFKLDIHEIESFCLTAVDFDSHLLLNYLMWLISGEPPIFPEGQQDTVPVSSWKFAYKSACLLEALLQRVQEKVYDDIVSAELLSVVETFSDRIEVVINEFTTRNDPNFRKTLLKLKSIWRLIFGEEPSHEDSSLLDTSHVSSSQQISSLEDGTSLLGISVAEEPDTSRVFKPAKLKPSESREVSDLLDDIILENNSIKQSPTKQENSPNPRTENQAKKIVSEEKDELDFADLFS